MPAANLDAAVKLIGEAKAAGADYVQTPEMTNIMEVKRDAAVRHDRGRGEADPTLAAFRELARKLAHPSPYRLAGDQGLADKARRTAPS